MIKNYYEILGVNQEATTAEIELAYRTLSLKFHPDKNAGDRFLGEMFKKINEAYHILSNENKRRDYDRIIFDLDKAAISREENPGDYRTAERCSEQGLRLSISEYVELIAAVADKHEALYNAKINPRKSIRDQAAVSVIVVLVCIVVLVAKGKNGDHDMGNTRYSGAQSVGAAKSEDGGGFNFSEKIYKPAISSVSSDDVSILRSENISEVTERSDETPVSQGGGPLLAGSSDSSIRHYVIAASNLGLRASPGDESPVVRVVPQGKSVLHMGKFVLLGGVRWANVATGLNNEVMGWVNEGLLVPAERPNIKQSSMSGLNGSAMLDEGKAAIGRNRDPEQQSSDNVTKKKVIGGHVSGRNPFLDGF